MKKSKYPFRLGTTSYIIPADILTNLYYLAGIVDDIELVLFETPGESNLPSPIDINMMNAIAKEGGLTFTVHLPTDKKISLHDKLDERDFVESVCKTIVLCKPLVPYSYILHLEGITADISGNDLILWQNACYKAIEVILKRTDISPELLCIENLAYPWAWYKNIIEEFNLSYCLDIGHLWATATNDWDKDAEIIIDNARVIHLHGLCSRGDHCSLANSDPYKTELFLNMIKLKNYNHVVTLEIFNENDLNESLDHVRKVWEKLS